jgi:3-oxoacyl-[acyl-carrier-protein] synthase II
MSIYTRPRYESRRVVVTGMGLLSPVGNSVEESWSKLIEGQSGIDRITHFDASSYDTQFAGEVRNFDIDAYIHKKEQKKMDRFIHFSLAAAKMALQDAGLEKLPEFRSGVIVGVGIGGLPLIEKTRDVVVERGPSRVSPFFIPAVITNLASGQISIQYGIKGPNFSVTSACATGAHSLGEAAHYIRRGQADVMIAGGSEAAICPLAIAGFNAMKAMSTRNDAPQQASRPWDRDRDGFVLSEGAGIVILEDYEHAARRGAHIYAELTGYGVSSDAFHMTGPSADGEGAAVAMRMAL